MTDSDEEKTQTQPSNRMTVRLSRGLFFYYEQARRSAEDCSRKGRRHLCNFCKRIVKKIYTKPRFAVEVAALVVVVLYTTFAFWQSWELTQSVKQQVLINRPVIFANGISATASQDGVPSKVRIIFRNFGKTVALNVVPVGHIEVGSALASEAPHEPRCDPSYVPPRFVIQSALSPTTDDGLLAADWDAPSKWDLTEYKKDPIKNAIYVVGCVYYESLDHRRYYSDVCAFWQPDLKMSPLSDFPSCIDSQRNTVQ